jgi:hypothetical protein
MKTLDAGIVSESPGKKWLQLGCCLMGGLMLVTGCSKSVKIKAYIDGSDTVKIQGRKIWFEHEEFNLPGDHDTKPTLINGKPWRPEWNDKISAAYVGLDPVFIPHSPADIKLTKLTGRDEVKISEMPSPENNQTLAVHFNDEPPGADWYEVTIAWK